MAEELTFEVTLTLDLADDEPAPDAEDVHEALGMSFGMDAVHVTGPN